ncbi:MAG TPA: copper resistance protein CopC [Thermoleophilaceae bacterium]|nr:copper resistance protein CopC [Thermoleophilaceae bacterium]
MAFCLALVALTALPAGAFAHAVVEQTQPTRGAALERSPELVTVTFDEPVESSFGALRVFAADGARVDVGEVQRPSGDAVAVRVEDDLPDGAYTVTYRVVSADSHPVTGGYVFTVGKAGGTPAAAVADLLEEGTGSVTEVAFGAVRAVSYAAIALLAGGFVFLLLVWLPALRRLPDGDSWAGAGSAFQARATRLLVGAAFAGLAATVLGIVLQAATATGGSFWSALDSGLVHDVLNTRFGEVWKLRFTAFGVLAALLLFLPPATGRRWASGNAAGTAGPAIWLVAFAAACAYLIVSPALGGHAGAADDSALVVPLDVVHVAAMSAWVGGVALLLLVVPAATRRLDPPDRTRLLALLVTRFSTLALTAVAALLATGIAQSILHLDELSDLVDTAFGRAILVKAALFVALIALGAYNRRRSQPALARLAAGGEAPGHAGGVLRRTLRAEIVLMGVVLAVTAALVAYSPSAATPGGPFSDSADFGPARIELTVDPARAGSNEIHVYLFDKRNGAQYDRPRRLTIAAVEPELDIGPIALDVRKAGPGHYTVARADLAPAGAWSLVVRAPLSDFQELRTAIEVPIR